MKFKIYKPGQGYWTRLMSGLGAAVLVVAGVAWLWAQLETADLALPQSQTITITPQDLASAGDDLLNGLGLVEIVEVEVGEPVGDEPAETVLRIERLAVGSTAQMAGLRNGDTITSIQGVPVTNRADIPAIDRTTPLIISVHRRNPIGVYVQAGVAVVLIVIFGLLVFNWVGAKPNTSDFLIATEGEMKKVNWPAKKEVIGATWVVIACVVMFAALLFVADVAFSAFFKWIKVLDI